MTLTIGNVHNADNNTVNKVMKAIVGDMSGTMIRYVACQRDAPSTSAACRYSRPTLVSAAEKMSTLNPVNIQAVMPTTPHMARFGSRRMFNGGSPNQPTSAL